jgi:hypothetical protein
MRVSLLARDYLAHWGLEFLTRQPGCSWGTLAGREATANGLHTCTSAAQALTGLRAHQRGWVVWHVLKHDLHHGGEIGFSLGLSLGLHGLPAPGP